MTPTDRLRAHVERRLWKAGLTPLRIPDHRPWLEVAEYPGWCFACHQTQHSYLWGLYDDAQAESPDPSGHFALITVDRRDDSEVVTFGFGLLEAWWSEEDPFVIPRRKRRLGFAHHSQLSELAGDHDVPLLVSCQTHKPVLFSVPLPVFKRWLRDGFPLPQPVEQARGDQLGLTLWEASGGQQASPSGDPSD